MWKNPITSAISQDDSPDMWNLIISFMAYINPGISMVSSQTKRTTKTKKWSSRSFLSFSLKGLQAEDFEAEEEHTSLCHQRFF